MSKGTIKKGRYGKYYEWVENGSKKTLAIKHPGLSLTEDQLDELIENKKLDFENENGETISATIELFYNENIKRNSLCIRYNTGTETTVDKDGDTKKIMDALPDIVKICEQNEFFDIEVGVFLRSLNLSYKYVWCVSIPTDIPTIRKMYLFYGYKEDYKKNPDNIYTQLYIKREKTLNSKFNTLVLGEEAYKEEVNKYEEQQRLNRELKEQQQKLYQEYIQKGIDWVNSIKDQLYEGDSPIQDKYERIKQLGPIVKGISPTPISTVRMRPPTPLKDKLNDVQRYVKWRIFENDPATSFEKMKLETLSWLREYYDYHKLKNIRDRIHKEVDTNGLDSVVDKINVDIALDMGRFKEVKKVLKKKANNPIKHIIYNMFLDEDNEKSLEEHILNMLKVYQEFFDFPAKDVKALAKFIAANNLEEYFDKVLEYDAAVEVLINEQKIPGKLRAGLKNKVLGITSSQEGRDRLKSFKFTIKTRVKDNIIVHDPARLLEDLRALIDEYNRTSDVAIIHNIELSPNGDEFEYHFYTFSTDNSGNNFDGDGRRLKTMTMLYNRRHKPNIYFNYD